VDLNEWLSVNTIDFFNEMSLMLGSLLADNICTKRTCPQMRAGPKFKYMWADGVKYKTPVVLCATEYIDCLMDWVESQLDDEDIFPVNSDNYPKNFQNVVKTIFRRLFRVYAHLYHHHFEQVEIFRRIGLAFNSYSIHILRLKKLLAIFISTLRSNTSFYSP